jgi:hypothetical protein
MGNFCARETSVATMRTLLFACLVACGSEPAREERPVDAGVPAIDAALVLPEPGAIFPESQIRIAEDDPRDAARLADVETCGECHADVLAAWRSSPHARASFDNPWYRQAIDSIRDDRDNESSRFCAGCHDPVLLVAGAMEEDVRPDDPRAHAGVTCLVCHGIQEVRPDGVASYTLSTRGVFLPDPADADQIARHVREVTPSPLRTAQMCFTCHRGFLGPAMGNGHHISGIDDPTAYQRSGYAGSAASRLDQGVQPATCQGCHMPMRPAPLGDFAADDGMIHSHRFPGAHTAMAAGAGDEAQLEEVRTILRTAARIDVAAVRSGDQRWLPADGAAVGGGDTIELDVVVHNRGTGHRFPGGTIEAQDTWVELVLYDANGTLIAEDGAAHEADPAAPAHRLHAIVVDADGEPTFMHRVHTFTGKIFDHTLGPRDAEIARYAVTLPEGVALPIEARARLMHRRHNRELHGAACESQRTERGEAFRAQSIALGNRPIDACQEQPITELSTASVWIGGRHAPEGGATTEIWRRLFDHALALIGDVQEHLDDARPSLDEALRLAPGDHERAMVLVQRGRLEGRQGRLDAALDVLAQAEALVGPRPAIHRMRGDAYAQVWRWQEAAAAYALAAEGAPLDDTRWVDLARALGSSGDDRRALDAARRGLAIQPRDESLLRTQYLAIDRLGLPRADVARDAFLLHRVPDELPALRLRCAEQHAWCGEERLPIHVHEMSVR